MQHSPQKPPQSGFWLNEVKPWKIHTSSAATAEQKYTPLLRSSKTPENNKKPVSHHGIGTGHQAKTPPLDFSYGLPFVGAVLCISGTTESQLSQRVYRGISYVVNTPASLVSCIRTIRYLQAIIASPADLAGLFYCLNIILSRYRFRPSWCILRPVRWLFYSHITASKTPPYHHRHFKPF